MSSPFARVFNRILDSSIAQDFTLRHVFEDFLKLAEYKTGTVDMTREAIQRRLNIPIELLNANIEKLEGPDPQSRNPKHDGRRLMPLDPHRNWGWQIVNWEEYRDARDTLEGTMRVREHRERKKFQIPTLDEVKAKFHELNPSIPPSEAIKFFNYYQSNGWKVGRNPMKSYPHAIGNWMSNYMNGQYGAVNGVTVRTGPTKQEVLDYAKQKWPDDSRHTNWAISFHAQWHLKGWKRDGKLIDWQIEFSTKVAKIRGG